MCAGLMNAGQIGMIVVGLMFAHPVVAQVPSVKHVYGSHHFSSFSSDPFYLPQIHRDSSRLLMASNTKESISRDGGVRWTTAPIPSPNIGYDQLHWVRGISINALSFDDIYGNNVCSVIVFDRDLRFMHGAQPFEEANYQVLYAFGDTLVAKGTFGVRVSTDSGKTWRGQGLEFKPVTSPYEVARSASGNIVVRGVDSVISTADAGLTWQRDKRWRASTHWFYEFGDSVLLSTIDERNDNFGSRLHRSTDAGATWQLLDTIRCTNTGRLIPLTSRSHTVLWFDRRENRLTVLLGDGDVLTTLDSGATWLDRGNVGRIPNAGRNVTTTHDDHAMVSTAAGLWRIPLGTISNVSRFSSERYFGTGLQMDDSTCFATAQYAFVRSSDGGRTWLCWYEPLGEGMLTEYPRGVYLTQVSTIAAIDSTNITISQNFKSVVYQAAWSDTHWRLLSVGDLSATNDEDREDQYVAGRQMWSVGGLLFAVTGDRRKRNLLVSSDNGLMYDTVATLPGKHVSYVTLMDSVIFVADDSLRARGTGTWQNVGTGLPTDSLGVQRVQAITKTHSGKYLAALAGVRYIDTNGVATDIGGGLYERATVGGSWTRVPNVSEHEVNVMHVYVTQTGAVLATMAVVTKESTLENLRQDDNVIVRSDDNGSSWREVYHDVYGGPALLNPLRIVEDSMGTLYASRTRGEVLSSVDDGLTWQEVPNWNSSARINDMTVDTNDVLYVATDSAVIMVRPTSTDISADDNSMYLSLSLQPNPAKLQTHIVIGNASKHTLESLTLVGTLGQATLDLTPQLLQQSHLKTARIDLDTSSIPVGTYIAALRAGTQTRHIVLCVMR